MFQLTTYCTSIHLVVKRYQAKWWFIYFYTCQLFLVVMLAWHYCLFLQVTGTWSCYLKFSAMLMIKKASGLFLKVRIEFFVVPCFWRTIFLSWSAGLRKSKLSGCKFQWWPEDRHWWDTRASSLRAWWAGSTSPMLGGATAVCPEQGWTEGHLQAKRDRTLCHKLARRIFKELPLWEVMVSLKPKCTADIQLHFTWIFFWKKTKEKMSK